MKHAIVILLLVAFARANTPSLVETLAGTYRWSAPGSTWTLLLRASGDYSLTTESAFEKAARPIESGRWQFEGFTVVLSAKQTAVGAGEYRRLHVLERKSGRVLLVSALRSESYLGEPFGHDTLFDYVFVKEDSVVPAKKRPNQTPEPTTLLGTSAAEQPLVPSRVVAHL